MHLKNTIGILFILLGFTACENEVDLTGEYVETPVIIGLLNHNTDTQFVRINKTFLEDGANATELAKDPNRLIYDTLNAYIINKANQKADTLSTILMKKESGVFSDEKNILYYTTMPLSIGNTYELVVETPTGLTAKAETKIIDTVKIDRPSQRFTTKQSVTFKNFDDQFVDYAFQVSHPKEVARFDIKIYFLYEEITNQGREMKSVEIPVGQRDNAELRAEEEVEVTMSGRKFYRLIANEVPKDGIRREVAVKNCIRIEIYAADQTFRFYSKLNGPIDGLSQVRPEYSNIENGIGIFASRTYSIGFTQLNKNSRQELISGPITSGRGFVNP